MRRYVGVILSAGLLSACSTTGKVSVKPGFDFHRIERVGVLRFKDARGLPDSGLVASDMVAQELIESGLSVIERSQLKGVLKEQRLGGIGVLSRKTAKRIGRILGVDAVVVGNVKARILRERTTIRTARGRMVTTSRHGRHKRVRWKRRHGPGEVKIYESDGDLDFDITAKMVLVETGEIVWIISAHSEKRGFQSAVDAALKPVMKKVRRAIQRSLKRRGGKRKRKSNLDRQGPELKNYRY